MLEFLNQNAGALTVMFTAVVTLSTVVYAILTAALVKETGRMRQAQTEPKIEITLRPSDEWINLIRLHLKNIDHIATGWKKVKIDVYNSADREKEDRDWKEYTEEQMREKVSIRRQLLTNLSIRPRIAVFLFQSGVLGGSADNCR